MLSMVVSLLYALFTVISIFFIIPTNLRDDPSNTVPHIKRVMYKLLTCNYKYGFIAYMLAHLVLVEICTPIDENLLIADQYKTYLFLIGIFGIAYLITKELYTYTTMTELLNIPYIKLLWVKDIDQDIHNVRSKHSSFNIEDVIINHVDFIFGNRLPFTFVLCVVIFICFIVFICTYLQLGEVNFYISKYYPGLYHRSSNIELTLDTKLKLYEKITKELEKHNLTISQETHRKAQIQKLLDSVEDTIKNNKANDSVDVSKILNDGHYKVNPHKETL